VWTVLVKELTETLRDRRSLFMLVGLPILLYPLMLIGFTKVARTQSEARAARASVVAVWGSGAPAALFSGSATVLEVRPGAELPDAVKDDLAAGRFAPPPPAPPPSIEPRDPLAPPDAKGRAKDGPPDALASAARAAIAGDVDVVVVVWPGFAERLAAGDAGAATVYHDSVDEDSRHARDRVERALELWRDEQVKGRLAARDLPAGFARAVDVTTRNVAPEERRAGQRLGAILPFVLIVMSLMGGFYASIDLTAGEKERGTMQTLLCAPVLPSEVIAGKFLTVWAMTILAGLANVGSIAATLFRILPGDSLGVRPEALGLAFLLFLPVSFTTSACFLAVGAFARDFKDGQNFITPVYLILSVPSGFTMLPGVELSLSTAFVPVLNIALLIKGLLLGEATPDLVFLTVLSSGLYAALALSFAARVFQREQVLLGGSEPLWVTLGLERRTGQTPSPAMVLAFFAVVMVVIFYASLLLERRGLVAALVGTQLLMGLPTVAWVLLFGLAPRRTLSLRAPSPKAVLAGLLVGASAWAVVAGLVMPFLPTPPESLSEGLEKLLRLGGGEGSLWLALLLVAVAPGVCEELLFRGFALSGLKKLGAWPGIVLAALLFGLAHSSIHRLAPTMLLGVFFGYLVLRSGSVFVGMLAHLLNNGLAVLFVHRPELGARLGIVDDPAATLPWSVTLGAVAMSGLGLWLASTLPPVEDDETS
jgi:sodium transport system permease protein